MGVDDHATANYPGIGPVVETWDQIAATIGKSRWTARRWATRNHDPLPVSRLGKIVYCPLAALEAWLQRNRRILD